jgi:hypothetical protein
LPVYVFARDAPYRGAEPVQDFAFPVLAEYEEHLDSDCGEPSGPSVAVKETCPRDLVMPFNGRQPVEARTAQLRAAMHPTFG